MPLVAHAENNAGSGSNTAVSITMPIWAVGADDWLLWAISTGSATASLSIDWVPGTPRSSGFDTSLVRDFAYGNGVIVAVGGNGKVATSTDGGINWVLQNPVGVWEIRAVAFGNGRFVLINQFSRCYTSVDGITWDTGPLVNYSNKITYANGLFVSVGTSGSIFTSVDGLTWTSQTSGFGTEEIRGVTYGDGKWVAVGGSTGVRIATSTDGITWIAVTKLPSWGSNYATKTAFGDGLFVVVGLNSSLATSTDGTSWTNRTSSFSAAHIYNVAYNGSIWVAAGWDGKLATSTTGTAWTQKDSGTTSHIDGLLAVNGIWLVGANNGQLLTSPFWTPLDTITNSRSNRIFTYARKANPEDSGATFTATLSANGRWTTIVRAHPDIGGVDVHPIQQGGDASTSIGIPAGTASKPTGTLIAIYGGTASTGSSRITITAPSGYTSHYATTTTAASTLNTCLGASEKALAAAEFSSATATASANVYGNATHIVLLPAATNVAGSDTFTATDSAALGRSGTDKITISDSAALTAVSFKAGTDSAAFTDAASLATFTGKTGADTLTVNDSATLLARSAATDVFTVTETAQVTRYFIGTDTYTTTETAKTTRTIATSDTLVFADLAVMNVAGSPIPTATARISSKPSVASVRSTPGTARVTSTNLTFRRRR